MAGVRFRFEKGRAGFATDSNCNHFLRIYIFKKDYLRKIDNVLLSSKKEEKNIEKEHEMIELHLKNLTINIVNSLNVLFTKSNDSTFAVKRILFQYNEEDDFYTILVGVKYNNTLTPIIDIRLQIAKACMELEEFCFFVNNRDTHEPLGNFDTSHVSDEPFKNYDASAVSSVLKPTNINKKSNTTKRSSSLTTSASEETSNTTGEGGDS